MYFRDIHVQDINLKDVEIKNKIIKILYIENKFTTKIIYHHKYNVIKISIILYFTIHLL